MEINLNRRIVTAFGWNGLKTSRIWKNRTYYLRDKLALEKKSCFSYKNEELGFNSFN